ncbi:hypothetical protein N7U66_04185 [Lacinutrix neustonica]|uniref:DUF5648 domain-containing protein n=1 Tax=Lacinutrix neustonica TaxID=2980107 RepID=A0A9E8SE64_9FLAO|nr:hypothetical protein [Lacinutrix neustonica]WAC02841.1 hypothetical protein N7U66_04185 [Lacinutrix neustonica]
MSANIYQFYRNGDHFYTNSFDEGVNAQYAYERTLGTVATSGPTYQAITRWYNLGNGDRVITTGVSGHPAIAGSILNIYVNEYGQLISLPSDSSGNISGTNVPVTQASSNGTWRYEGILGYTTGNSNSLPVHTYYNHNLKDHIYLTDFNILGNGGNGYVYEGIAFYI